MRHRYFGRKITKTIADGFDASEAEELLCAENCESHDDDSNQCARQFLRYVGCCGDDGNCEQTNDECWETDSVEVLEVDTPLADEVSRNLIYL